MIRDKTVVYLGSGDYVIILSGSGDSDELELSSFLDTLHQALLAAIHAQSTLVESKVMGSYARFMLVLDGFATTGVGDTLDAVTLKRTSKWAD